MLAGFSPVGTLSLLLILYCTCCPPLFSTNHPHRVLYCHSARPNWHKHASFCVTSGKLLIRRSRCRVARVGAWCEGMHASVQWWYVRASGSTSSMLCCRRS